MGTSTTIRLMKLRQVYRYAEVSSCPRCQGSIFVEETYHEAQTLHEFRCIICGWRDDVRHMDTLVAREAERQAQRAATQHAGAWSKKDAG